MKLRHLEYFVAAAEELNFTHAAGRLNVSQPPFSKQIQDLESELGINLFQRERKGVALTAAGKGFLIDVRGICNFEIPISRCHDPHIRGSGFRISYALVRFLLQNAQQFAL